MVQDPMPTVESNALPPRLIDAHCHLDFDYGEKGPGDLIGEAAEAGVSPLITIGTDPDNITGVAALSDKYHGVYHTVGVHPHEARRMEDRHLGDLMMAAAHPRCVAIGEIGLDYHYKNSAPAVQRARLRDQLDLALVVGLPVVIHAREADDDLLAALDQYAAAIPAARPPGVIHCFSGPRALGQRCLELGFFISFSGMITFGWAEELRACARDFPLDRLMVETDAPYLAPSPFRGKRCEPHMVRYTAEKLAQVREITVHEVAEATVENTCRLFGLMGE